jgi:type IV pilus assembly protein PilB
MLATSSVKRRIGELLVERGIISQESLESALKVIEQEPESVRRRLPTVLIDDFGIDSQTIMSHIADFYAFKEVGVGEDYKQISRIETIRQLRDSISPALFEDLIHIKALPYESNKNNILIATADPTDPALFEIITKLPFRHHEIAYLPVEKVKFLIAQVHEQKNEFLDLLEEYSMETTDLDEELGQDAIDEAAIDAEINQSMLNSLVEGMLVEAVRKDVSDIHVIPVDKKQSDIYFRVDGKLQIWLKQTNIRPEALTAVIKDKTRNVDRFERDSSQDGFIQRKVDGHQIRYRVSIIPMVGSDFDRKFESVVIRILDDRKVITDLKKLGLQTHARAVFEKSITKPSGIVIITGPTGSGKSTTLVAALYSVIDPSVNVLTVEEPVEYLISGARQLKISDKMTFDQAMRGILRHDPDIVLVGEVRDLKTAEIAMKLANTGHLTFSTLHTNDAPSAVARLYKMGVEPFLIANSINMVMAQRLIRRLCEFCKEPDRNFNKELAKGVGFTDEEIEKLNPFKACGCAKCNKGFKGRMAIHEALYFDKEIKEIIFNAGDNIDEDGIRQTAIRNGMLTLRASGRERIKDGHTTINEVLAATIDE